MKAKVSGAISTAFVIGAALLLVTAVPLHAQTRRAMPADGQAAGVSPVELQQLFDAYVMMQAQESLKLSESQYPRFLPRLKALQEVRRRQQTERTRIVQDLRRLVQGEDDAANRERVTERLTALKELETKSATEVAQAVERLDEVLEPVQRAKLRILEEQMERRKLELLMRARQGARARAVPQR
jgi:hypothetical protein